MGQRNRNQPAIGLGQSKAAGKRKGGVDDSKMGQLRALRPPRSPRCVEDHGDIFLAQIRSADKFRSSEQVSKRARMRRLAADGKTVTKAGELIRSRNRIDQIRLEYENLGSAVVE